MKTIVAGTVLACLLTAGCGPDKPQGPGASTASSGPPTQTIQYVPRMPLPAADGAPAGVMTMGWIAPAKPNGSLKVVVVTPSGDTYDTMVSDFAFTCTGKPQYVPSSSTVYGEDGQIEQQEAARPPQDIDGPSLFVSLRDLACDGTKVTRPEPSTEQITSEKDWGIQKAKQFTAEAKAPK